MIKKKINVTFLFDKSNNWIEKFIRVKFKKKSKKYNFKFSTNFRNIKRQKIVFILGYTKILPEKFLKRNEMNLVVHESALPKGKGFAPVQWQILQKKNKIPICLLDANKKPDSGDIYEKFFIKLKGNELNNEIRKNQALTTIKIINRFLKKYPKLKKIKQSGKSTFYKKRGSQHSKLNINKSIKVNFNLLRVVDNEKYPAYFVYKKRKYLIKIEVTKP